MERIVIDRLKIRRSTIINIIKDDAVLLEKVFKRFLGDYKIEMTRHCFKHIGQTPIIR